MWPPLAASLLLLAVATSAPSTAAVCVPRKPGRLVPSPAKLMPPTPKPKPTPAPPGQPKPTPIAPGGDIVKALCAKTDYPDVCQSSIEKQPPPPAGKKLDSAAVLRLAMGAVRSKVAEAKKAANALVADPKTAKLALEPLHDCAESYDDISYSLDQADKAMVTGDKDTTGTMLDTCRTDVDTCDQGFEEREELTPLMSKYDAELAKLASNCLAIATASGLR